MRIVVARCSCHYKSADVQCSQAAYEYTFLTHILLAAGKQQVMTATTQGNIHPMGYACEKRVLDIA